MSTIKVDTIKNTSNVEVYTCKAWVNFNGTGTVAIRASGNVSSITDNGTGDYTVNFATAMADANYSTTATSGNDDPTNSGTRDANVLGAVTAPSTTAVRVGHSYVSSTENRTSIDATYIFVAIFR
jgi:hypothetical protein